MWSMRTMWRRLGEVRSSDPKRPITRLSLKPATSMNASGSSGWGWVLNSSHGFTPSFPTARLSSKGLRSASSTFNVTWLSFVTVSIVVRESELFDRLLTACSLYPTAELSA